jgi:hypothetical protein
MKPLNQNIVGLVLGMVKRGEYPPSEVWDFCDESGNTVAHRYVEELGPLPPEFDLWDLADHSGWTVAHSFLLFRKKPLPKDFRRWGLATGAGVTPAHIAAMVGLLPSNFTYWGLSDARGNTVAHAAADFNNLPSGFGEWGLRNNEGDTVAHTLARRHPLPEGFSQWHLTNAAETVLRLAVRRGHMPKGFDDWGLRDFNGEPAAHIALQAGKLPWASNCLEILWSMGIDFDDLQAHGAWYRLKPGRSRKPRTLADVVRESKNPDFLAKCCFLRDQAHRRAAAKNPRTPPDALALLAEDLNPGIRKAALERLRRAK